MTWTAPRLAIACAALATGACVSAALDGHACPCLDGSTCVNGTCFEEDKLAQACPERFVQEDACGDTPLSSGTLIAVCDDGEALPLPLLDELGAGAGACFERPPVATRLEASALAGSFTFTSGDGEATLALSVTGDTRWALDLPAECMVGETCLPSDGSGSCRTARDGCTCTGVDLPVSIDVELDNFGSRYVGERTFFGCAQGNTLLLREDEGIGLLGPILLFATP